MFAYSVEKLRVTKFMKLVMQRHFPMISLNPLTDALKPQSNGPLYSNTVIGILAVNGWAVTFGTARRGPGFILGLTFLCFSNTFYSGINQL